MGNARRNEKARSGRAGVRLDGFLSGGGGVLRGGGACLAAGESEGRWEIQAHQVPIKIGNTVIHPGDFVFSDVDGVVIVPAALTLEVLKAAEEIYEREAKMRAELRQGLSMKSAFEKYGAL